MSFANPLVHLENVGVRRDNRWLVQDITLSIQSGEILTLIGPNGAGKTTTAKLALGLIEPTYGTAERRQDLVVGYVPQSLSIDWTLPLTVERFMRLTGKRPASDVEQALAATGVAHLRNAEVRTLSGGEFQRAMLARAIARRPGLLVLDEPVQGVDFAGELALYDLIGQIRKDFGCGILMISHDLHVVMAATDRVVCLNGHICCEGEPKAVAENPEYKRLFGARAAGTLALYQHRHDHTHLPDGRVCRSEGEPRDAPSDVETADGDRHAG